MSNLQQDNSSGMLRQIMDLTIKVDNLEHHNNQKHNELKQEIQDMINQKFDQLVLLFTSQQNAKTVSESVAKTDLYSKTEHPNVNNDSSSIPIANPDDYPEGEAIGVPDNTPDSPLVPREFHPESDPEDASNTRSRRGNHKPAPVKGSMVNENRGSSKTKDKKDTKRKSIVDAIGTLAELDISKNYVIRNPDPFKLEISGRNIANIVAVFEAILDYEADYGIKIRLQKVISPIYAGILMRNYLADSNWRYNKLDYLEESDERIKAALIKDQEPLSLDDFIKKLRTNTLQEWKFPRNMDRIIVSQFPLMYVQITKFASRFIDVYELLLKSIEHENAQTRRAIAPEIHKSQRQYVKREGDIDPRSLVGLFLTGIPHQFGADVHAMLYYMEKDITEFGQYVDIFMKKMKELYDLAKKQMPLESMMNNFSRDFFSSVSRASDRTTGRQIKHVHAIDFQYHASNYEDESQYITVSKEDQGYDKTVIEEYPSEGLVYEPEYTSQSLAAVGHTQYPKPILKNPGYGGNASKRAEPIGPCYLKFHGKPCEANCPYDHSREAMEKELQRLAAIKHGDNLPIPNTRIVQPSVGKHAGNPNFSKSHHRDDELDAVYYDAESIQATQSAIRKANDVC